MRRTRTLTPSCGRTRVRTRSDRLRGRWSRGRRCGAVRIRRAAKGPGTFGMTSSGTWCRTTIGTGGSGRNRGSRSWVPERRIEVKLEDDVDIVRFLHPRVGNLYGIPTVTRRAGRRAPARRTRTTEDAGREDDGGHAPRQLGFLLTIRLKSKEVNTVLTKCLCYSLNVKKKIFVSDVRFTLSVHCCRPVTGLCCCVCWERLTSLATIE